MIEIAVCEECGHEDITGYIGCAKKQLCPDCAAKYMVIDAVLLRLSMMEVQAKEAEAETG